MRISKGGTLVTQFKNGKKIRTFDSITEAARITKINITKISQCCKGMRGPTSGYMWQYADVDKRNDINNVYINIEKQMSLLGYDYDKLSKSIGVSTIVLKKFDGLKAADTIDLLIRISKELQISLDDLLEIQAKEKNINSCPFCGNSNLYCYDMNAHTIEPDTPQFIVRCDACGAKGPIELTKNEAIDKWNDVAALIKHD